MVEQEQKQEAVIGGVPHRQLDGFDELKILPPEQVEQLLADAPDYIKQRAAEWLKQRQAAEPEQQAEPAAQ